MPFPKELPEVYCPEIDRCIGKGIYEKTFSAAACVASVGYDIFHRKTYGCPISPPPLSKLPHDTLFDLASLTKPLGSGLAALVLASTSRLDLGAPMSRTLKEFKADPRWEQVTIDMLLDHTSGLPASRSYWDRIREMEQKRHPHEPSLGTERCVPLFKKFLAEELFETPPGTRAVYSDLGFMALGWIVEGIVGQPLDVWLMKEVYRPLGIHEDLFFIRLEDARVRQRLSRRVFAATEEGGWRDKLLQGEVHDPNAWAMGGVAGHAGLFGTVDAVWKLVATLWGSFKGEDRHFLAGTLRRFWTRSKRLRDTTWALGWDTPSANEPMAGKRFSRSSVGHLGFTGCSIWIDLSTDIIGVVLTNSAHPSPEGKQEAMRAFRPRVYEHIGKEGETILEDGDRKTGAAAFYSGPLRGGS